MIDNQVIDIVQPDLNYNGGFVRAAKVAKMARKVNMWICPHDTQTGAATVNILQFAAMTPNIGPFMEYVSRKEPKKQITARRVQTVVKENRRENRKAKESRNIQDARGRRKARTRRPVF